MNRPAAKGVRQKESGKKVTKKVTKAQRLRNDNINKICVLEGVREGENLRKIVQNAVFFFLRNSMTIKFGNFANFIVRILLSFGRLLKASEKVTKK